MHTWCAYNVQVIENTTGIHETRTQFVSTKGSIPPFQKIVDYYNENNYSIYDVEELKIFIQPDFDHLKCFLEAENYSKRLDEISNEI